jgi:hypothetical protein
LSTVENKSIQTSCKLGSSFTSAVKCAACSVQRASPPTCAEVKRVFKGAHFALSLLAAIVDFSAHQPDTHHLSSSQRPCQGWRGTKPNKQFKIGKVQVVCLKSPQFPPPSPASHPGGTCPRHAGPSRSRLSCDVLLVVPLVQYFAFALLSRAVALEVPRRDRKPPRRSNS